MDTDNVILDLISDEEVGWGEKIGVGDDLGGVDDCKWIQEFFNDFEEEDGSGDVGVVSEDIVNPSIIKRVDDSAKSCGDHDGGGDDDDDCVILDGDPDKAVEVETGADSEELVVVGEKGQVACRDYPHPRHLCAKYPFPSTPHEMYCNQCHCYVCDSPAPCLQWGSGIYSTDHCHANGKEEIWSQQRECVKKIHQSTSPDSKDPFATMSTRLIQTNQFQAPTLHTQCDIPSTQAPMVAQIPSGQFQAPQLQLPRQAPPPCIQYQTLQAQATRLLPISSIQNHTPRVQFRPAPVSHMLYRPPQAQTPRPASMRACTTATNINAPNIRGQWSGLYVPINIVPPGLGSQQLYISSNNVPARDRRHTVGVLCPRVNVPSDVFKRTRPTGVALTSCQKNDKFINTHGSKFMRNRRPVSRPGDSNTMSTAQKNAELNKYQSTTQANMQMIPSNLVAFQPQLQPQLSSQQSVVSSPNPVTTQPLGCFQSTTGNGLVSSVTFHPQIPSHQAYVGDTFLRPVSPQPQVPLQPIVANSFGNTVSSQPPVYSQPIIAPNGYQNVPRQQNRTNNFMDTSFTDLDLNWLYNPASQSSQQQEAENSQLQGLDFVGESIPFSEFDCVSGGSTNIGSLGF